MRRLFLPLIVSLFFSGCTAGDNGALKTAAPSRLEMAKDGVLTLQMRAPDVLNPLFTSQESNRLIYDLIFDPLFSIDNEMKPAPSLAEGFSFSPDGLILTLSLRQDVSWHDGRPFGSRDVEYTINKILEGGDKSRYREGLAAVSSCSRMGEGAVYLYLSRPRFDILEALDFPIIPAHVENLETTLVGTGQYKFVKMIAGRQITLEANSAWALGEAPLIGEINVRLTDNDQDAVAAFSSGEISVVTTDLLPFGSYGMNKNTVTDPYYTNKYEFLGFNTSEGPLASSRLRRAISFAIDRRRLVSDVYFAHAREANAPVHPKSWLYFSDPEEPYYNLETTRGLLFEDGWADNDGDGVLDREHLGDLSRLSLNLLVNLENGARVGAAGHIARFLEEVGIKVNIKSLPWDEYSRAVEAGDYDMFLGAADFSGSLSPFLFFRRLGFGNAEESYAAAAMDALISRAEGCAGAEQYKNAIHELQRFFNREAPAAGICFVDGALLRNVSVKGDISPEPGGAYRGVNKWFLVKQE